MSEFMRIELLYIKGCPNVPLTMKRLRHVLERNRTNASESRRRRTAGFFLPAVIPKRYSGVRSQIMIGGYMSDNISGLCSEMFCVETDEPPSSTPLLNL